MTNEYAFDTTAFDVFPMAVNINGPSPNLSGTIVVPGSWDLTVLVGGDDLSGSVILADPYDVSGSSILEL